MRTLHTIAAALLLVTGATVGVLAQDGENASQPEDLPANATNASDDAAENETAEEAEEDEATVTICHVPPGNPDARHTIEIGEPAWQAHEGHGDHKGACEGDAETAQEDTSAENETDANETEDENASEANESDANESQDGNETNESGNESEGNES